MPIQRHFLGSDTAPLPQAAARLLAQMKQVPGRWVVAVPTARAGRRLREHLALQAGGVLADPPQVAVAGHLLEALWPQAREVAPDGLLRQAQLALALRELPLEAQVLLSRQLGAGAGIGTAWAVAGRLLQTLQAIWGGGLRAADLAQETPRHGALAQLEALYAKRMPSDGDLRRLARLQQGAPFKAGTHVVLLGCMDLPGVVAGGLRQWAAQGLPVHAWVAADGADADAFDDLGQVLPAVWSGRGLPLAAPELVRVASPAKEYEAVLRLLERAGPVAPSELTLVLGDEAQAPLLAAQLEPFGLPCRVASGDALASREPGALALALLALWGEENHAGLRQLAAVWPKAQVSQEDECALLAEGRQGVLDDLRALPPAAQKTAQILERLQVLPKLHERLEMGQWAARLAQLLAGAFPGTHAPTSPSGQALQAMGERLRVLASLPLPPVLAGEAAALMRGELAALSLPSLGGAQGGAELVGILEALLDDAPILAVVGAVEGALPKGSFGDALLPDSLRARLGLPNEKSLRARDKAILTLAKTARRQFMVCLPRHGLQGDPLQPAQLLLEGLEGQTLAARCLLLFGEGADLQNSGLPVHVPPAPAAVVRPGGADAFLPILPRPVPQAQWQAQLENKGVPVTALRKMLACPARFALEYAEGCRSSDEVPAELEGNGFGNLLHEVLRQFHQRALDNPAWRPTEEILAQGLEAMLRQEALRTLGPAPGLAVALQLERAVSRLQAFARQQAQLWGDGWQIAAAEKPLETWVEAGKSRVRLHGRIDRVDRHPTLGLRIMDFKSGDEGKGPRQTHLNKQGWLDLQLPGYIRLAWDSGLAKPGDLLETGFFLLDPAAGGWVASDFDEEEIGDAFAKIEELLAQILRQEFPVGEVPDFDDGLGTLLCDMAQDRAARLGRVLREGGAQ